jgi:hypothetical protein
MVKKELTSGRGDDEEVVMIIGVLDQAFLLAGQGVRERAGREGRYKRDVTKHMHNRHTHGLSHQ